MKLPKVSIVVVNFNGKKYLKKCFDSIFKLSYPKNLLEVIMVDNVSEDNSVEFVRKNFPKINIVYNNINNYCKANNLGIMKSKADFIAFVNNDTWVNKDWLMELVKVIVQDKKIGCVGSKILLPNGRINSVGHQEFPNFYWGDLGLRKVDSGSFDKLREVKSLCGCSLLIRRPCLNEIGFFDEDFMMYLEDIDISLRCQKAGWKQILVPRSII